jgi:hypothetical protein
MLAIAVSLLFGLAAFAALAAIASSLMTASQRFHAILAELGEIERRDGVRRARVSRPRVRSQTGAVLRPALAAA